jgi:ABC-2 type transport system ATP-binding protein
LLDVESLLTVQVRKVSLGERMKLELLAALVHRPRILFLDEPTIGLDVVAKARVRSFLADLNELQGTTIVLTSHDMDDIEALCSRVMIIDHGRIGYDGALAELVRSARPRKLVNATYAEPVPPELLAGLGDGDLEVLEVTGPVLRLAVSRERTSAALQQLTRLGPLVDLDVTDTDIDEIIRDLFSQQQPFAIGGGA